MEGGGREKGKFPGTKREKRKLPGTTRAKKEKPQDHARLFNYRHPAQRKYTKLTNPCHFCKFVSSNTVSMHLHTIESVHGVYGIDELNPRFCLTDQWFHLMLIKSVLLLNQIHGIHYLINGSVNQCFCLIKLMVLLSTSFVFLNPFIVLLSKSTGLPSRGLGEPARTWPGGTARPDVGEPLGQVS